MAINNIGLLPCLLLFAACVSAPKSPKTTENTLSRPMAEILGVAYEKMQAEENEQALVILDAMLKGDTGKYSLYELATIFEMRGSVNAQLKNHAAAKADFKAAHDIGVLGEMRQAELGRMMFRMDDELRQPSTLTPIERGALIIPEECEETVQAGDDVIVRVGFDIAENGTVDNLRIIDSTNDCFDEAVMENVSTWKYEPQMIDGHARRLTGQEAQITYSFYES